MSLLAGFDFVSEISNRTILNMIKGNLKIQGVPMVPPFQIEVPIQNQSNLNGNVSIIIEELYLDLVSGSEAALILTMNFDGTTVMIQSPINLTIGPLDGTFYIQAPLKLVDASTNKKKLVIDLGNASINTKFSTGSENKITSSLQGLPISIQMFKDVSSQVFTDLIHSFGQQVLSKEFIVIPGIDGTLSPLQFERLEIWCVNNDDRGKQALCLMGTLLKDNHNNGYIQDKTETAITAYNDLCVSISPGAFHLLLCQSIATALDKDVSELPPSFGRSDGVYFNGVTITNISYNFNQGYLDLNVAIEQSGFCYDAHATVHSKIAFEVVSGSIFIPKVTVDDPIVEVDIPWYCWLAAGIVLGPLGLIITKIINSIAEDIGNSMAKSSLNSALGNNNLSSTDIKNFANVGNFGVSSFKSVLISPEGLTLEGTAPFILIPDPMKKSFQLSGSVLTVTKIPLSKGTFNATLPICDIDKEYPYTEYSQQQTGIYTAIAHLLTPPLNLKWEIRVPKDGEIGAGVYPLIGNSGTIVFPIKTDYPFPLPGGSSVTQLAHIDYSISDNTVKISNNPHEGNYTFYLYAKVTDYSGTELEAFDWPLFMGDTVEIGGGYYEDQQSCGAKIASWVNQHLPVTKEPSVNPIAPIDHPAPEIIAQSIYELAALNTKEANMALLNMKVAHGSSYYRGLYSKTASKVGLSTLAKTEN